LAPTDEDGVRTSEEVAALLSQALEANKVREPFVLIAHSLSGQYALRYAKLHPDKVAALVLLDGRMKGYTAACAAV
jgi:pimeloyl-ACP methyl ester carboxylesterase